MKFKFCTIINCIDISEYDTHVLNLNATKADFIKQKFDGAIKITKTNETLTQIKLICVIPFRDSFECDGEKFKLKPGRE